MSFKPQEINVELSRAATGTMSLDDLYAGKMISSGNPELAVRLYRRWLSCTKSDFDYVVMYNLGVCLVDMSDDAAAEVIYRKALTIKPNFVECMYNLAALLERKHGPNHESIAIWTRVTDLGKPLLRNDSQLVQMSFNSLGRMLELIGNFPDAEAILICSLAIDPHQVQILAHVVHLRQKQCKYPILENIAGVDTQTMLDSANTLCALAIFEDPQDQLQAAIRYTTAYVPPMTPEALAPASGYRHDRIRIGYLSSNFNAHAVSILTAQLYELHDRAQFEIYAFSWSQEDCSPLRQRVTGAMDHYHRIDAMTDKVAAQFIRSHEIDILVDLQGLTAGGRPSILGHRPAPVQVTWLGFPGTTALPCIDYVIADKYVLPPEDAPRFTEAPLYMPTFQINDRKRQIGKKPTRASCELPEDAFVFCAFNAPYKITEQIFDCWMSILLKTPGSVLWLVTDDEFVKKNLIARAGGHGIALSRIVFAGKVSPQEYLARYQVADLFLDTSPFNGGTTVSDALWAGLPVLTLSGRTFASRMGESLLHAAGLPELIATSIDDYSSLAVHLATEPFAISTFKNRLQENRLSCALFDSEKFVIDLETQFKNIRKFP